MIVLDASAAVEMARGTKLGKRFEVLAYTGEETVSVELLCGEVASTFSKYVRFAGMDREEAAGLIQKAVSLVDRFHPMQDLYVEAFGESVAHGRPLYDMFYLVLARRTGATLFTADKKLSALALRCGVNSTCEVEAGGTTWGLRADTDPARGRAYTREELLGGS